MNNTYTYKVTGLGQKNKFHDDNAYHDSIHYITNPQKAMYVGSCNIKDINHAAEEMEAVSESYGKNHGKRVRHSILSFGSRSGLSPEQAAQYASQIIQHYAPEYQMVYALHVNTDDLHVHFVMNQTAFTDGHKYSGKKLDYYQFLDHIRNVTHHKVIPVR